MNTLKQNPPERISLADRIQELVAKHGSLREVARKACCDVGYLSRLMSGQKLNPSDALLRRLGLTLPAGEVHLMRL